MQNKDEAMYLSSSLMKSLMNCSLIDIDYKYVISCSYLQIEEIVPCVLPFTFIIVYTPPLNNLNTPSTRLSKMADQIVQYLHIILGSFYAEQFRGNCVPAAA